MKLSDLNDDAISIMAIRFALARSPKDENGKLLKFNEYKQTFITCLKWARDHSEHLTLSDLKYSETNE